MPTPCSKVGAWCDAFRWKSSAGLSYTVYRFIVIQNVAPLPNPPSLKGYHIINAAADNINKNQRASMTNHSNSRDYRWSEGLEEHAGSICLINVVKDVHG